MPKKSREQTIIPVEAELYPEEDDDTKNPNWTTNPPGHWYFRIFKRKNNFFMPLLVVFGTLFILLTIILFSVLKIHHLLSRTEAQATFVSQEWYIVTDWISEAELKYEVNGKIESCDARDLSPEQKKILYSSECILIKPKGEKCIDIKRCEDFNIQEAN